MAALFLFEPLVFPVVDGAGTLVFNGGKPIGDFFASRAASVAVGDFDDDGGLDVISANYYGNMVAWYMNEGTETFSEEGTHSITRPR